MARLSTKRHEVTSSYTKKIFMAVAIHYRPQFSLLGVRTWDQNRAGGGFGAEGEGPAAVI